MDEQVFKNFKFNVLPCRSSRRRKVKTSSGEVGEEPEPMGDDEELEVGDHSPIFSYWVATVGDLLGL